MLVYSPDENGRLPLVAVEHAVPLNLSQAAPDRFEGSEPERGLCGAAVYYRHPDAME